MRDELVRIAALQPQWSSKNRPAMEERGILVRRGGPEWLRSFDATLANAIGIPLEFSS
jgi:hypothetical protein